MKEEFKFFIATPLHDGRVHQAFVSGLLDAWANVPCQWSACNGTGLMRQRDTLLRTFIESDCTHILWVDSDIGWRVSDALRLLETGKDFVGGCYARKNAARQVPTVLLPNREGELYEAEHVATGMLLVTRAAVEKMLAAFTELQYTDGASAKPQTALFLQNIHEGTEDLAFCRRWREIGGQVWLHTGVQVAHYDGCTAYMPDLAALRAPIEAEQQAATAAE